MAAEEQAPVDFSKLSIEELIVHKNWQGRVKGYEDALKLFGKATSEKDPVFNKFLGHVKHFVSDSNPTALDKGMDATLLFLENAAVAPKTAGEVCPILVQKCLVSANKKKTKPWDILLMYVEIEKPDAVVEALIEGLQHKNPKVAVACLEMFTMAINQFGTKVVSIKSIIKQIGTLMQHRDKDIRAKTKALCVEIYRWIGTALKPQLTTLTPIQLTELEAAFATVGNEKAVPTRYLRSQQPKLDEAGGGDNQAGGDAVDGEAPTDTETDAAAGIDPWDLLDPFDVVTKLPSEFYEMLESKKWSERKEKLDELDKLLTENPRLETGAVYGELVSVLKKILAKDSNINVVNSAGKCLTGLALGLRKKFSGFASMCIPVVLEKFKEKNKQIIATFTLCIDAIAKTTTLEAMSEEILAGLDNKTPSVKMQTAYFLQRYFAGCSLAVLNKKILKLYCPALTKLLNDPDDKVRLAAADAVGTAMKVVGEKTIMPFLDEIANDHLKMDKIKEFSNKAEINVIHTGTGDGGGGTATAPKKTGPAAAATARPPIHKPSQAAASAQSPDDIPDNESQSSGPSFKQPTGRPASAAVGAKKPAAGGARPATATAAARGRSASSSRKPGEAPTKSKPDDNADGVALIDTNQKLQRFQEEKSLKILKWQFNTPSEEHISQLKAQLALVCKPMLHVQMFHIDFKQHLKALDTLIAAVDHCPDAVINTLDLLLKWCTVRFFDTNPSVLVKCLALIKATFGLCRDRGVELHDLEVHSFVPFLLLKLGEQKEGVRTDVRQIFNLLYKLYPASKIFPLLMDGCKSKNARQRAECLDQIGMLIELYGVGVCGTPTSAALKAIAQNIGDRDNTVRNSALNAVVAAYMHLGERTRNMIGNINAKDLAMLDERIKRTEKNKPIIRKPDPDDERKVVRPPSAAAASKTPQQRGPSPSTRTPANIVDNSPAYVAPGTVTKTKPSGRTGMFKLDVADLDDSDHENGDYRMPDLAKHVEADEILAEPIQVPRMRYRPPSGTPGRREMVTQSMDASSALDTAISSVTSKQIDVAFEALVQLEEIIKDPTKCTLLVGKVDQLFVAVFFQFRMSCNTHMADPNVNAEDVVRLYRNLCLVLLSVLSAGDLVQEASEATLKDLFGQLLTVMLDARLEKLSEGTQFVRTLNILVVKLVEKSNNTSCLVALMRLLRDTLHSQTSSAKFQQLVLKCIWKLSRLLPQMAQTLDLRRVLAEAHAFFVDFPSATWKVRQDDTPARTVKTIINKLAEVVGDKMLDYVDVIERPDSSEVVAYLKKSLRELHKTGAAVVASTEPSVSTQSTNGNSDMKSELREIFKKIGSKEKSKEGIVELYNFQQKHPDIDIKPFMQSMSDFFRSYIERGLKQVESENNLKRMRNQNGSDSVQLTGTVTSAYFQNLQSYRATLGLEPSAVQVNAAKADEEPEMALPNFRAATAAGENGTNHADNLLEDQQEEQKPRLTADEINDYKARLERLKRGGIGKN